MLLFKNISKFCFYVVGDALRILYRSSAVRSKLSLGGIASSKMVMCKRKSVMKLRLLGYLFFLARLFLECETMQRQTSLKGLRYRNVHLRGSVRYDYLDREGSFFQGVEVVSQFLVGFISLTIREKQLLTRKRGFHHRLIIASAKNIANTSFHLRFITMYPKCIPSIISSILD